MGNGKKYGIIGGYGRIGIAAAKCLLSIGEDAVMIGGRNAKTGEAFVQEWGVNAFYRMVEIYDRRSLNGFCKDCDIVINCAGPSAKISHRVATAALRHNTHYVDVGGYDALYRSLSAEKEIALNNLTFIVSAGIYPGLSEVFPAYTAKSRFDCVDSLEYYYAVMGDFSLNSAYDTIVGMRDNKDMAQSYYQAGGLKKDGAAPVKSTVLPQPVGQVSGTLTFNEEMLRLSKHHNIQEVRLYNAFLGELTRKALFEIWLATQYGNDHETGYLANLLVDASTADLENHAPCNMLHMVMKGKKKENDKNVVSTICVEDGYELCGMVAANTARIIMDGAGCKPGCFFLHEGVDVVSLMTLLRQQGIIAHES